MSTGERPLEVATYMRLETLTDVLLMIKVFRYIKNSRQYETLHIVHLHGHLCVCVCVCVTQRERERVRERERERESLLLLNPLKDLPFLPQWSRRLQFH